LKDRHKIKFCSNKCQQQYRQRLFIDDWKVGVKNGTVGINVRTLSGYVRHYLIQANGEKCSQCGWSERHEITKHVPLEVDHIDGDSENSKESNLRLLCPNCHSLTMHFRNLNKGRGRKWRMEKYKKNVN